MAFMAVKRNRKKNQTKKNFDEIFKKFDHNQNQRVSIREFTEVGEDIFKVMVGSYTAPTRVTSLTSMTLGRILEVADHPFQSHSQAGLASALQ